MRVADLNSGPARLNEALKKLHTRWEATRAVWHDPVSREFEENYLAPLDPRVLATMERMNRLAQVMASAIEECRDSRDG